MRIIIADDHTLVRAGVRRLVDSFDGCEVVAEAQSARDTLDLAARLRPDLILLDLCMPDGNGIEVIAGVRRASPETQVVVLSMYDDLGRVREALDHGACGFVVKEAAVSELELALRSAVAGQTFLSPQISAQMIDSLLRREKPQGVAALSPRQRQILHRLGRGETNKEIAATLGISAKTVETHRARMMETLGVRRAAELLRIALRHAGDFN